MTTLQRSILSVLGIYTVLHFLDVIALWMSH
jgi:hypothetical protein